MKNFIVNNADLIGTILTRTMQAVHTVVLTTVPPLKLGIERRFLQNSLASKPIKGFIYGQRKTPQRHLKIGAAGNGGNHGCGPVALYNAMLCLYSNDFKTVGCCPTPRKDARALDPPFFSWIGIANIIKTLEYSGAFNLGGLLGTNPIAILDFLHRANIPATIAFLPVTPKKQNNQNLSTLLDTKIKNSAAAILLFWDGGKRVHYIMIRYVSGTFWLYNCAGNDISPTKNIKSITQWLNNAEYTALAAILISPMLINS
ncbi:MAG: hypothetical protein FWG68_07905 [Defluviitaleaceae bacterium]|nr:hypothetical protein [Defluviitaleaceae bacterium]